MIENLDRGPPMEDAAPSIRGGMKSRRSISFSVLLGGYPGIFQGPESRLGEAEDEEGEASEENEVVAALAGAPEAYEAINLALSTQPISSQGEPNVIKMMEQITQLMGTLSQEIDPRENPIVHS
ncbi:hypothetical protein O181_000748 [Austropuccinia psidii MF-1]|uniref:Uncharacterized protein n=1 Tax=Austropuccinia psidii MF-1 TaxID=1389203 RepID=A0A9Q3GB47_9BASI|nr:hypothetical protein [Austropuccinia psidii MF-1]